MNDAPPNNTTHCDPGASDSGAGIGGGVTLQISVAPRDASHAREILPHQLRQWGRQVDEILFTLDLGPTDGRNVRDLEDCRAVEDLLAGLCGENRRARLARVDYASDAVEEVRRRIFAGRPVPRRDCYGKAVYPYFFGLLAARNRYVLHVDSDMLFGGGSPTWVAEGRRLLDEHAEVFSCSPLPGPPSADPFPRRVAIGHAGSRSRRALASNGVAFTSPWLSGPALRFSRLSTRDFMIDRSTLDETPIAARDRLASIRGLAGTVAKRSIAAGDLRYAPAETMLSRAMGTRRMIRVDFLGQSPGMWSLHPATRSRAFHRRLPDLIRRIEEGEIPAGQRGDYDLNSSML